MKNTFYSNLLKCNVRQIDKRQARKLFYSDERIFLHPSNLKFDNPWQTPMPLMRDLTWHKDFDTVLNDYMYYNCDSERGRYVHFFVAEKN